MLDKLRLQAVLW